MKTMEPFPVVDETTGLRELLQQHPKAIRVLLDRDVPISCAGGTVGDAARACGVSPTTLVADLLTCTDERGYGVETDTGKPPMSRPGAEDPELLATTPRRPHGGSDATTVSWHALPLESVLDRLQVQPEAGLSSDEAGRRLAIFGPNTVQVASGKKRKPWWRSIRWASPGWSGRRWTWY